MAKKKKVWHRHDDDKHVKSRHEAGFDIGENNMMETLIHHTLTYVSSLHKGQIPTRQCVSISDSVPLWAISVPYFSDFLQSVITTLQMNKLLLLKQCEKFNFRSFVQTFYLASNDGLKSSSQN